MFSKKTICLFRKDIVKLSVALSIALFCPAVLHAADEHSYVQEIEQDVAEDKVYLLENIRQKVSIPSEKTVVEALLTEDGPQAIALYRKQLREYPDPALDKISTSRIAAYTLALDSSAPLPMRTNQRHEAQAQASVAKEDSTHSFAKPRLNAPRPSLLEEDGKKHSSRRESKDSPPSTESLQQETIPDGASTSTLQFGSFENRGNAVILAKKVSQYAPVEIVQRGQMYKVQLKKNFASQEKAAAAAQKLPLKAIVVPSI